MVTAGLRKCTFTHTHTHTFCHCCSVVLTLSSYISLCSDACDLTLDPNTVNVHLCLSEENRKVTRLEEQQSYPDHPDRFDFFPQVVCREGLLGRCYW